MGFNAATAVEALEYDFTTLNPCPDELREAKGVIPEPDIETLNRFSEGFYGLLRMTRQLNQIERPAPASEPETDDDESKVDEVEGVAADPLTVHALIEEWQDNLAENDDSDRQKLESALVDWLMIVCRPVLTEKQLMAIPGRVRTAFVGWLTGELITPKGSRSASAPSLGVIED